VKICTSSPGKKRGCMTSKAFIHKIKWSHSTMSLLLVKNFHVWLPTLKTQGSFLSV
jgi:hypothetical protein